MVSVKINGIDYELTDNPKHRTVKKVRKMRVSGLVKLLTENRELIPAGASIDQAIGIIGGNNPTAFTDHQIDERDSNMLATISLATEHIFTEEEIEDIGDNDLYDIFVKCAEVLGGDANDFLNRFDKPISFEKSSPKKSRR